MVYAYFAIISSCTWSYISRSRWACDDHATNVAITIWIVPSSPFRVLDYIPHVSVIPSSLPAAIVTFTSLDP